MNRNDIHKNTLVFFKENKLSLIVGFIIIALVNQLVGNVFGFKSQGFISINMLQESNIFNNALETTEIITTNPSIINEIVGTTLETFMYAGFSYSIVYAYRNQMSHDFSLIINSLSKKTVSILTSSLLLSSIIVLLDRIPFVGVFLGILFAYASFYTLLIIYENDINVIDSLKSSFDLTRGHKFKIFLLQFNYILIIIMFALLAFIIMLLGPIGLVIGLGLLFVAYIRFTPCVYIATSLYYIELQSHHADTNSMEV